MNYQQFFDTCGQALLESKPFPSPRPASFTDNHILLSFKDIRDMMDPNSWPSEVSNVAKELDLCDAKFKKLWENWNRKAVSHG